jgi:peptidoglycan/LPS O-acetylase OafA/YrhL
MLETAYQRYQNQRHFGSLDGVRALAILSVILHHTTTGIKELPVTQTGFLGVDMFFVLSGFLICTLLLREQKRTGTIGLKGFYIRRSLRIFPAYYALLIALTLLYTFVSKGTALSQNFFASLPYNLTYTSNWIVMDGMIRVLWSLATEEQFYLIWPAVQKYAKPPFALGFIAVVIIISQLFNFPILTGPFRETFGVGFEELNILQVTFTPIALGVVLAYALNNEKWFNRIHAICSFPGAPLVYLIGILGIANLPTTNIAGWPRLAIQLTMAYFLASCVVREDHILARPFQWWPIRRIGIISYGLYLYHSLAQHFAVKLQTKLHAEAVPLFQFALTLFLSWIIAEISFRILETPFLKWKDRRKLPSTTTING